MSLNVLTISHLVCIDDSLLFAKASLQQARKIKDILPIYELGFGQKVNRHKSKISFSPNT